MGAPIAAWRLGQKLERCRRDDGSADPHDGGNDGDRDGHGDAQATAPSNGALHVARHRERTAARDQTTGRGHVQGADGTASTGGTMMRQPTMTPAEQFFWT